MRLARFFTPALRCCLALVAFSGLFAAAAGAPSGTGTIEGRVLNVTSGDYLEKARITVEGTSLETFTDAGGYYRLNFVPAGEIRLKTFFTGVNTVVSTVNVLGDMTIRHDISLSGARTERGEDLVVLPSYVVTSTKETNGAAIAINEQRFAPNIRNVVAADEFGPIAEGNVGEFMKFLPGISIDYVGGDARTISINGVPPQYVPITVGGFDLASAQSSGTARTVELEGVSINNLARIEVEQSPTPESVGSALAGSVNLIPRSAFERSKPSFEVSAYLMMRPRELTLGKTPGPLFSSTRKVNPGFDFTYIKPVNRRFGFSISGASSTQYSPQSYTEMNWRGTTSATNGTTNPDTTVDNPYLVEYKMRDGAKITTRSSLGTTVDYKFSSYDSVSFSFQYAVFDSDVNNRTIAFTTSAVVPGGFDIHHTTGAPGQGNMRKANAARNKVNTTYMPTLIYRHRGPIWQSEAGLGLSHAVNHYRDIDRGYMFNSVVRRSNVTVSFADNGYERPGAISVTDGATALNPWGLSDFSLISGDTQPRDGTDIKRNAYANIRREFSLTVPLALKAGVDVRQAVRDIRGINRTFRFVGADGRASETPVGNDDSAAVVTDESFATRQPPYGFPQTEWVDDHKLWQLYQQHPDYFTVDENAAYQSAVSLSKRAEEVVSSAYLRGDVQFFQRRLALTGGVRAEQTNAKGEGQLIDTTLNYQRDAQGKVILGPNNAPLPIDTDPLAVSKRTRIERGLHATKEYLRLFPSVNVSYKIRDNLIARGAYYWSIGRPDFSQYAGSLTLPDTEAGPSTTNRISVNNVSIKPWSAKTTKVSLEYYLNPVGIISVGAFQRDFENFFGSTVFKPTPEFFALYDLDPNVYGGYDVATQYNIPSTVRMTGLDVNYKQALTFLPDWARGIQVFGNISTQRAQGDQATNFSGFIPKTCNWGISLTRERFDIRANWNYRGRARRGLVSGRGIEPDTYTWSASRLYLDITAEYGLNSKFSVFGSVRNLNNAPEDFEIAGPNTPAAARFRQREEFSALLSFGIKGTF